MGSYDRGVLVRDVEMMPHSFLLSAKVSAIVWCFDGRLGDPADNFESIAIQAFGFRRVVGYEAKTDNAEVDEDSGADCVTSRVDRKALRRVRVDGVQAVFLQRIRADLMPKPDPATLVSSQVNDCAAPFVGDRTERLFELAATVTAERADDIAS